MIDDDMLRLSLLLLKETWLVMNNKNTSRHLRDCVWYACTSGTLFGMHVHYFLYYMFYYTTCFIILHVLLYYMFYYTTYNDYRNMV